MGKIIGLIFEDSQDHDLEPENTQDSALTKAEIKDATAPKLTFTAYAVQRDGIDNVTDAWAKVNP